MSASLKPLTVDEFLACERAQALRFEFDGIQPVALTGGSLAHARITTRLTIALGQRVKPPCEPLGPELKVLTPGRVGARTRLSYAPNRTRIATSFRRSWCSRRCRPQPR